MWCGEGSVSVGARQVGWFERIGQKVKLDKVLLVLRNIWVGSGEREPELRSASDACRMRASKSGLL